ncbi:MAG: radical SAM protein [Candidatus Hydrothermota bacterium]|nr:MAG: radical SAM protein [Candidatus Hydrothermae bacterium]
MPVDSSPSREYKKPPEGSLIKLFDPWKSPFCTCPLKYSLNPYTGCALRCHYCYITAYIPDAFRARPKVRLLSRVERDLAKIDLQLPIAISNSTDPYQPLERVRGDTGAVLRLIGSAGGKVIITTKSDLVLRDLDLLSSMRAAVMITITGLSAELSRKMEPGAPLPECRLRALCELRGARVPVGVRLDPLIPGVNTDREGLLRLLDRLAEYSLHVTASTYKPRADNWKRMKAAFGDRLRDRDYSERVGRTRYLRRQMREELLSWLKEEVEKRGMTYATCREGLPELQSAGSCDGTHLIPLDKH